MIKLYAKWALTRVKMNIRSFSFWLMTLLMVCGLFITDRVIGEYSADTKVLICPETGGMSLGKEDETCGEYCYEYLSEHKPEGFVFEKVNDPGEVISRVSTDDVSCAVVFEPEDIFAEDKLSGLRVTIYQSEGSADGYVVREIIYPVMARYASESSLEDYVTGLYGTFPEDSAAAETAADYVADRYREYLDEFDLDLFETVDVSGDGNGKADVVLQYYNDSYVNQDVSNIEYSYVNSFIERAAGLKRTVFMGMIVLVTLLSLYDSTHTHRAFLRSFAARRRVALVLTGVLITVIMSTIIASTVCVMSTNIAI